MTLTVERFEESRCRLRRFFEMTDDSPAEIERYIDSGEIFVARHAGEIVGHVQVLPRPGEWEIKSISVLERWRRNGVGTALVRFVLDLAVSARCTRMVVGTATADLGNILFYERLGFRFDRIERDVFTAGRGCPALEVDGIPLRDRVWLSCRVSSPCRA